MSGQVNKAVGLFNKFKKVQGTFILAKNLVIFGTLSGAGIYGYLQYKKLNYNKEMLQQKFIDFKQRSIEKIKSKLPERTRTDNLTPEQKHEIIKQKMQITPEMKESIQQKIDSVKNVKTIIVENIQDVNLSDIKTDFKAKLEKKIDSAKADREKLKQDSDSYYRNNVNEIKASMLNKVEQVKLKRKQLAEHKNEEATPVQVQESQQN